MRFVHCWDMSETRLQKGCVDLIGGKLLPGETVHHTHPSKTTNTVIVISFRLGSFAKSIRRTHIIYQHRHKEPWDLDRPSRQWKQALPVIYRSLSKVAEAAPSDTEATMLLSPRRKQLLPPMMIVQHNSQTQQHPRNPNAPCIMRMERIRLIGEPCFVPTFLTNPVAKHPCRNPRPGPKLRVAPRSKMAPWPRLVEDAP